jgi:uncharacterized protein
MSRADQVTAEPGMDDLLASIRRAIHDEGLDFTDTSKGASVIPLQEDVEFERGEGKDASRPPRAEPASVDANEIVALRNKISRELNRDSPAPVLSMVPVSRSSPARSIGQGPPAFKSLLGGKEPVPTTSPPATPTRAGSERSVGTDRHAAMPSNLRRPVPAPPVRPHYDPSSRPAPQFRPPFGQSSSSVRRLSPVPVDSPTDGMISPETSNVAAGAFSRLAEQMFGREDAARSIDDLARELLHPMLKQWLDENLPRIVEQLVREEIERVARRGRR